MATYAQVLALIKAALVDRTAGTKVQVENHQVAEIAILDYIEQQAGAVGAPIRQAHASATADTECDLIWDVPFTNTSYSFSINGFEASGDPVIPTLVSKEATKLVIRTLVNCTICAMAKSYV